MKLPESWHECLTSPDCELSSQGGTSKRFYILREAMLGENWCKSGRHRWWRVRSVAKKRVVRGTKEIPYLSAVPPECDTKLIRNRKAIRDVLPISVFPVFPFLQRSLSSVSEDFLRLFSCFLAFIDLCFPHIPRITPLLISHKPYTFRVFGTILTLRRRGERLLLGPTARTVTHWPTWLFNFKRQPFDIEICWIVSVRYVSTLKHLTSFHSLG